MIRSVSTVGTLLAVASLGAALASCNGTRCGAGTKLIQQANGQVECVLADEPATGNVPCDVDGGNAEIKNGECVSHIICDPATTTYDPVTGVCVGTGGSGCKSCPATVPANQICVQGTIYDFKDLTALKSKAAIPTVRVAAFEPLSFLANPNSTPLAQDATNKAGCYALTMQTPSSGLVAVGTNDPTTGTPPGQQPLVWGATGSPVVGGQTLTLDIYMVEKPLVDQWSSAGGHDYSASGAYVPCYFKDPGEPVGNLKISETMPAMGVTLLQDSAPVATAKYLKTDRTLDTTLTATSAQGCGLIIPDGQIHLYTGSLAGVSKFETAQGASAAGTVYISRIHDCDVTTAGTDPTCM